MDMPSVFLVKMFQIPDLYLCVCFVCIVSYSGEPKTNLPFGTIKLILSKRSVLFGSAFRDCTGEIKQNKITERDFK